MAFATTGNKRVIISILVGLLILSFGCRSSKQSRELASLKKVGDRFASSNGDTLPADLRVNVVDQDSSKVVPGSTVAIGEEYLLTDASGSVESKNQLESETINVKVRARGFQPYEESIRLDPGENDTTIALASVAATGSLERTSLRPRAYLTIDDGPSGKWTPKVLDILAREKVSATFFLVGFRASRRASLVRRIFLEGHEIGNHTDSHDYEKLYSGSRKNLLDSLSKNGRTLEDILGFAPKVWRPPGGVTGNFRPGWQSSITYSGYVTVLWNVSTGDGSTQTTSRQMVKNTRHFLDRLDAKDPAIILMHDAREPIVKALPGIIKEVRRRGYKFDVVKEDTRVSGLVLGPWRR